MYIQLSSAPLLLITTKKYALLSSAEANGDSEFLQWSKIFFELKKEFKVKNIFFKKRNINFIGLRKCLEVSFYSHARKVRLV